MSAAPRIRTFDVQSSLPSLPIPSVEDTLRRYFASASVGLSATDRDRLRRVVDAFLHSRQSERLQNALLNRSLSHRNWLTDWWEDVYCEVRTPLIPFTSLAALNPRAVPLAGDMQCERAADYIHHLMRYWSMIRRQELPVMKSRGVHWDMRQVHDMFNANRTPAIPKDRLDRYFATESEGACPSHMVILHRGHVWKMETLDQSGQVASIDTLAAQLHHIRDRSRTTTIQHSVVSLTADDRDSWAEARERLMAHSAGNARSLADVEQSVAVLALADDCGNGGQADEEELLRYAMCGQSNIQWADHSNNIHVWPDARITTQAEHSNADAIVYIECGNFIGHALRKHPWKADSVQLTDRFEPQELHFQLDDQLRKDVEHAEQTFLKYRNAFSVGVVRHSGLGNQTFRKSKIYGDTIVQIALQLAFAKLHGRFAPIYETASTRKFFHGRTETVRGRSEELVRFGEAVLRGDSQEALAPLFRAAYDRHNQLMMEATEGEGVDRHLLGLRNTLTAMNRSRCTVQQPVPALFTDPTWKLAGGDGNFLLSTSFVGYDVEGAFGYVCAMHTDGYGAFYNIGNDCIRVCTTSYLGGQSRLSEFGQSIQWALNYLHRFLADNPDSSKL